MMPEGITRDKKFIRAPSDMVSKLSEAANQQGKTFYSYIGEVLEQAVRAHDMKRTLKEMIDSYEVLEVHREAGAVLTPRHIVEYLTEKVCQKNGENLRQLWYQTGKWYGIYLKEKFNDPIEALMRLLREGRWDINDVTLKRDSGTFEIRCVSAFLTQERAVLVQKFIEGAVHAIGYKTEEEECFRGITRLKFSSRES